jgi:hypothetical protein
MQTAKRSSLGILAAVAGLAVPATSFGQTIYDAGGYEQPRFSPIVTPFSPAGPFLDGQDNPAGGPAGQGPWLKDQVQPTAADAIIQNAIFLTGSQAVQFSRVNGEVDTRYGVNKATTPTGQVFVDWDMRVDLPVLGGAIAAPFFGVEVNDSFDNLINSETGSAILTTALFGVDAATRAVTYQGANGDLVETTTLVNYGVWNHFRIRLNYNNDTYDVLLNGGTIANALPFVDDGSAAVGGGLTEIDTFTDAPLATLATSEAAFSSSAGVAYYDNYSITVPEPTIAFGGTAVAGMLALARRRRRA